ncbi:MAG: nuclear transport factor 2 family protein [Acidimicrobiales bacterium]|nr:nuclear transport factor 2 family protein [Acidimicrobiales bacterium]MDG1878312.1 nuclear transport factor 2 family protein [Acidimicrobiales bacterium]
MGDELQVVMALEDARVAALCEQDADTLDRLLSDSMVYVHSTGLLDTKQSFLDHVRHGPIQYKSFERSNVEAHAAGNETVIVRGVAAAGIEFDGKPIDLNFRYLAVWVQHGGAWRFEAWQSSNTG